MRFVSFAADDGSHFGICKDDRVLDLTVAGGADFPSDLIGLIDLGQSGIERAERLANQSPDSAWQPLDPAKLLAPIPVPRRNVFCLGMNYAAHVREGDLARGLEPSLPTVPVFFTKTTTAVTGPYAEVPFDAAVSEQIDWEVEMAVIIGRRGKNISPESAMEYVFGYTVVNDLSARDLQFSHNQFFKGKSLDGACPMGPCIVTADEISDPHALNVRCTVNGVVKQDSNTSDLIFDIPATIDWLSRGLTIQPGDVISTGTPSGVGFARTPPEFLFPGDVVECEVEEIGTIRNRMVDVGG
jgi:2-keto-4-pentenoate hydratase/2-oxohepta-3-ene-1,7-dioic acid hydratase in catechol pathway